MGDLSHTRLRLYYRFKQSPSSSLVRAESSIRGGGRDMAPGNGYAFAALLFSPCPGPRTIVQPDLDNTDFLLICMVGFERCGDCDLVWRNVVASAMPKTVREELRMVGDPLDGAIRLGGTWVSVAANIISGKKFMLDYANM